MFKNDDATLEGLSFLLGSPELDLLKKVLLDSGNKGYSSLSPEEIRRTLGILDRVIEIKCEGSFYLFQVYDSWPEEVSGVGLGYSLYERHGRTLEGVLTYSMRDNVPNEDEIIVYLKEREISNVYTGIPSNGGFLGVNFREDHNDGHFIEHTSVSEHEAKLFEENGINLISLRDLV